MIGRTLMVAGAVCLLGLVNENSAAAISTTVVISQIYGGGGVTNSAYQSDFIELHNVSSNAVSLSGWTVQYAPSAGGATNWQIAAILGGSLQPGQYYLIGEDTGPGGTNALPPSDASSSVVLSATSGKVALVNSFATLSSPCPLGQVIDFVSYGPANCSETSPAPSANNAQALLRAMNGCKDSENNAVDFSLGTPTPRNKFSPVSICADPRAVFTFFGKTNGGFRVQFNANLTLVNQLQVSSNLLTWSPINVPVINSGNTFSCLDTNLTQTRFYRVQSHY